MLLPLQTLNGLMDFSGNGSMVSVLQLFWAPALTNFEWPDGFFWKRKHGVSTAMVLVYLFLKGN